jgi:hypothetical protein
MIYLLVFYFESSDPKPTHKIWFELTGLVVIDIDCIDSCKFNAMTAPKSVAIISLTKTTHIQPNCSHINTDCMNYIEDFDKQWAKRENEYIYAP